MFRKYLVVLVGLVGGALLVTSAVSLVFTYRDTRADAGVRLRSLATERALMLTTAGLNAADEVTRAVPRAADGSAPTDALRREVYARAIGDIRRLAYVDGDGRERMRIGPGGPERIGDPGALSRVPAVRDALAGAEWGPKATFGPVSYPDASGDDAVPLVIVAVGEAGAPGGATVAWVSQPRITGDAFFWRTDPDTIFLVDADGRLLARPPTDAEAHAVDPGAAAVEGNPDLSAVDAIAEAIRDAEPTVLPVEGPAPLVIRDAGWMHAPDGARVLSASAGVSGLGWRVVAQEPRADVLRPFWGAVLRSAALLAVFLCVAVAASALLARRMVRPIGRLEAAARRIGGGALDERIDLTTGDELEGLSETFTLMAAQLRELYEDLEARVDARTVELRGALDENARLIARLEDKGLQLQAASAHKSEFLAAMSHELRTPLNAIIGFSDVLRERMFGDLNDRQAEYLEDIRVAGEHLLALINDLLDLEKIESGHMDLELAPVDVSDSVATGLMVVRQAAQRRSVHLRAVVDPALGPVEADGRRLRQVLFNLLSNAVRFAPEGGTVEVRAEAVGDDVRISVADDGPGIAADDHERVFEPFRQVGGARDGSGLGLALSRALAERHGGRLWVDSTPGHGSTFTLSLPRVAAGART